MALCKQVSGCETRLWGCCRAYQVLSQLDEYAAILFQDLECPLGTSLVAALQQRALLLLILDLIPLVQRCSVAGQVQVSFWKDAQRRGATHSFIQMNRAEATLPALSAPSYVPLMSSATVKRPTPAAPPAYKTIFLLGFEGRFVELLDWKRFPEPSCRRIVDWPGAVLYKELRHDVHVQFAGLFETRRRNVDDIEVFMLVFGGSSGMLHICQSKAVLH